MACVPDDDDQAATASVTALVSASPLEPMRTLSEPEPPFAEAPVVVPRRSWLGRR